MNTCDTGDTSSVAMIPRATTLSIHVCECGAVGNGPAYHEFKTPPGWELLPNRAVHVCEKCGLFFFWTGN